MTQRDNLLERLEQVNPVPDPSRLHEDIETLRHLSLSDKQRSDKKMTVTNIDQPTPGSRGRLTRRGLATGAAAAALAILVGVVAFVFVADDGTDVAGSGDVESGPITSFEDIAGTTYRRILPGLTLYLFFLEDGTFQSSSNPDLIVDRPSDVYETRFDGTLVFITAITSRCVQPDQGGTYEIHLLENGNLQFLAIDEDSCALRSSFLQGVDPEGVSGGGFVPVP